MLDNTIVHYVLQFGDLFWQKLSQQIFLVFLALSLAVLIGLPLGIIVAQYKKPRSFILATANIFQTIPSLALLAFLLPFFGIGMVPAIIALTLYSLLPIIRNTATGILNIESSYIEAANGLGFTHWQRLIKVEIPLAMPTIIAGIRIASAMCVGIATIAAFIGAGGLGDFINQGLAMSDNRLVLLGAIPAALLALMLDYIGARAEKAFLLGKRQRLFSRWLNRILFTLLLSLFVSVIYMQTIAPLFNTHQPSIRITSKNFTESILLSEIMAQLVEANTDLNVERKFNLGSTDIVQAALERRDVDLYAEYTGTAYLVVLKGKDASRYNQDQIYQYVKQAYQSQFNLTWLVPFGFNNSEALAVREDFAHQYDVKTISDLRPIENKLIVGVPAEFRHRADGLPGLAKIYHLDFAKIQEMTPSLMYQAIHHQEVNVISAFTTDGRIPLYQLRVLIDDKHLFPPYYAAPVIRTDLLEKYPQLEPVLNLLADKIDLEKMQDMNYQVDVEKQTIEQVAATFLRQLDDDKK